MSKFKRDSNIKILKKERSLGELLETLIYYPAEEVAKFFTELNLSFPRSLRINVLRSVLRDSVVETRAKRATLADEMNYRLSWFNQYTESQLVNLFSFYKDNQLDKLFLEEFWLKIIEFITTKKISEKDFDRLIQASIAHAKSEGLLLPDVVKYNNTLNPLFFDEHNYIDGLTLDVIRPVLYNSSTLTEIRNLGKKFGVNVPRRLKKAELVDIIVEELKQRDEYTEEKEKEIRKMSVLLIQRFAKTNDIKASTELKKEEIIEYILSNAKETKESYFVPSSSVYELEAHDVGESMPEPEIVEEEEIVEEVEEEIEQPEEVLEVVEETEEADQIVEEDLVETIDSPREKVVYVNQTDQAIIDELAELREDVEYLKAKSKNINVEKTLINTVQYSGNKPKKFGKDIKEKEKTNQKEDKVNEEEIKSVYIAGFDEQDKKEKKKRNPFWALLRFLLIILVIAIILLLIYGAIRPAAGYPKLKPIDDVFNSLKVGSEGMLDWYTNLIKNLFN